MFQTFFKFLYILNKRKQKLIWLLLLCLFTSFLESFGIGLVGPFITLATDTHSVLKNDWSSFLYNQFNFASEVQFISVLGLIIAVVLYLKSFLGFKIQKYIFEFGFGQQADLRAKLLRAYLTVPYVFHLNRNTAVLIQNILTETDKFANGILMPILFGVSNLLVILALTFLLLATNATATIIIFIILLLVSFILYWFKDKLTRWGRESYNSKVEMIRTINHGLGGFKETRIIGCEPYFEEKMVRQAAKFQVATTNANAFSLLPRYTLEPLIITFLVGFSITHLIFEQSADTLTTTLGIFGMASIRLLPSASKLITTMGGIKQNTYVVEKLYLDLKEIEKTNTRPKSIIKNVSVPKQLKQNQNHQQILSFQNQIELERVSYTYPNTSESSLNEISLAIKKGESVGLIGKSGAGKTTLVDVILGLLTPEKGDIKVDGTSIYQDLRAWQNLIGYIPQSIFLMDDTIERNIAFGVSDSKLDRQKMQRAIAAAQLTELISELPDGLKTVVGERGVRLSGGQRQRIGIARALYHQREILVLDEATSALDNETEELVNKAIKSLKGTKTMIIIAHRLSTIQDCDRIYRLHKGRVLDSGTYKELILDAS